MLAVRVVGGGNQMTSAHHPALGAVLLAFYECLTDTDKLDSMMEMLTSWLEDEGGQVITPNLDDHAEQAWRLLGQVPESGDSSPGLSQPLEQTIFKNQTEVEQAIGDQIRAEDLKALSDWLSIKTQAESLLLRVFEEQSTELVILSHTATDDGFILKRTGPEFHSVISAFVSDSFGLTPAELNLVEELLSGGTLREIADRLGKSWETLRSQVKTLTNKLGVKTQGDILRLVNQAATLMPPQQSASPNKQGKADRTILRPDGRTISYDIDGPRSDKTLVYLHGMIDGRHWPQKARQLALSRGWRVIRICRAGRGESCVNPKEAEALLQDHMDDVIAIMNHEEIDRFSIYAAADGFSLGYYLALQHPERVQMIIGIEVVPPILSHTAVAGFAGKMKTYGLACLYAPKTVRYILLIAMKKLEKMEDRYSSVHPLVGVELGKVEDADGIQAIEANFQEQRAHKSEGVWRDATIAGLDWAHAPAYANTRPRAALIHSENSLINSSGYLNEFAHRIGAPIYKIKSYLPLTSSSLPLALDKLEQV